MEVSDEEELETVENVDGFQLMPYQFEPEYTADERLNDVNVESSSDEEETEEEVDPEAWRVGNSNWCTCSHCGPMPTPRESRCCRELDVLEDKRPEEAAGNFH